LPKFVVHCVKSVLIQLAGIANTIVIRIETLDDEMLGLMLHKRFIEKIEIFLRRRVIRNIQSKISIEKYHEIKGVTLNRRAEE
jgi:hypothetical protein